MILFEGVCARRKSARVESPPAPSRALTTFINIASTVQL